MGSKKINIGIVISSDIDAGGGYQYEYMVSSILSKYHNDKSISLNFYAPTKKILNNYSDLNIDIKIIKENIFQKIHRLCLLNIFL